MKIAIAMVLALGSTLRAEAFPPVEDDWVLYGNSSSGRVFYWMVKQSRKGPDGEVLVWTISSGKAPVDSVKQRFAIKCRDETLRTLAIYHYAADGSLIDSFPKPDADAAAVIPGSVGQGLLERVCKIDAKAFPQR